MIDWQETAHKYGFRSSADLVGQKRPKVICRCDGCEKTKEITVRVKSRIKDEQLKWRCPSCVCLGRSGEISEQVKKHWLDTTYRGNQLSIKQEAQYRQDQAEKSHQRWAQDEYRSKLETGIDYDYYIGESTRRYTDQFTYDRPSFTNWKTKIRITCKNCDYTFERMPQPHLSTGSCPRCRLPADIKNLIEPTEAVLINDRTVINPLELDIFWPGKKLAVEYHGLYWHSYSSQETTLDKRRHQTKAIKCMGLDIKLIQMFDYEWQTKKNLLTSMINNTLGISRLLMARKLRIKVIDNDQSAPFLNGNHLQGHRNAQFTVALINDEEIMMVMSFSRHKDGYEVIRMATKAGYCIRGGASRLLTNFRRTHAGPVYTFADLRHSTAAVYKKLGFTQLRITEPNYYYYKNTHRSIMSRQRCQKHRLAKLLGSGFDPKLSEPENMFTNGWRRFWDAGHIKLVLQ